MATVVDFATIFPFFLILLRVAGLVALVPLFGDVLVPPSVKILFSCALALFFFNVFKLPPINPDTISLLEIVMLIVKEFLLGVIIGMMFRLAFFCVTGASEAIAQASGFSASRIFNPHFDTHETVMSTLFFLVAVLVFFSTGGEVLFLRVIHRLFTDIPLGQMHVDEKLIRGVLATGTTVLQLSLRMAGPMLFCLALINIGMGVAGRVVPTLNVMALSFTVTLGATLWLVWLFLPAYVSTIDSIFSSSEHLLEEMIAGMRGP